MPCISVLVVVVLGRAVVVVDVHDDVLKQGTGAKLFDEVDQHGSGTDPG